MSRWFQSSIEMNKRSFPTDMRIQANMEFMCCNFADRVRDCVGIPVLVTSGYRTPDYNKEIGGSKTSMHVHALAHDLTWAGISEKWVKKVARHLRDAVIECDFQFIWYADNRFIHVGLTKIGKQTEFLIKLDNGYSRFDIDI